MNTEPIKKGYKAIMSNGPEVGIDPDEIASVLQLAGEGSFIQVRQGIINPSHIVSIVEDGERRKKFFEDTRYDETKRLGGMAPLKDIFAQEQFKLPAPPTAGG